MEKHIIEKIGYFIFFACIKKLVNQGYFLLKKGNCPLSCTHYFYFQQKKPQTRKFLLIGEKLCSKL